MVPQAAAVGMGGKGNQWWWEAQECCMYYCKESERLPLPFVQRNKKEVELFLKLIFSL